MNKPIIKKVDNNRDKYITYIELMKRYQKAYNQGFYYECLFLLYSIIEDRTESFFYHIGFTNATRIKVNSNKKIKTSIISILEIDKENPRYNFSKLYYKLSYIRILYEWCNKDIINNEYELELNKVLKKYILKEEFIDSIEYLNSEWENLRNEMTHALCKKDINDVNNYLLPLIDNGMNATKIIMTAIKGIKRNHIRKKFRLQ